MRHSGLAAGSASAHGATGWDCDWKANPWSFPAAPERLSTPVAPGAIQVAGGQLIVLGVACGTMGGYPHIAHVISADLDRLGQLKPGDLLQFRRVTLEEARRLDRETRIQRRSLTTRWPSLPEVSDRRLCPT